MTYPWHITAINLPDVWNEGFFGQGRTIGIIDDGFYANNPDLKAAYDPAIDFNFRNNLPDATVTSGYSHGTKVLGVLVAAADGLGAIGVAYKATPAGYEIGYGDANVVAQIAAALTLAGSSCDVVNCSWGWSNTWGDNFLSMAACLQALKDGVAHGRGGLGCIFVFAAGNERTSNQNVNYHNFQNSPYTIAVAATDQNGKVADWSDPGAALMCCAPGVSIETTVELADGTPSGTSFSAPIVSGVIALMLEANPALTYWDVLDILARGQVKTDGASSGWATNGAGLHFSHDYGFGLIDAAASVRLARSWQPRFAVANTIAGTGNAQQFYPAAINTRLQYVQVKCNVAVDEILTLTSPAGTVAILGPKPSSAISGWTFTAACFFGENGRGAWTLAGGGGIQALTFFEVTTQPNQPPLVINPIGDMTMDYDQLSFTLPDNVFADPDGDALLLTLDAPTWLAFDAPTLTVTGTPPDVGNYPCTLIATDPGGLQAACPFTLRLVAKNQAPVIVNPLKDIVIEI